MGELFNKITENEYKMIEFYRDHYAGSGCCDKTSMKDILRVWEDAKIFPLGKLFNNNLILEKDFEYSIPFEKLVSTFDEARWNKTNPYYIFVVAFDYFLWTHRSELGEDYYMLKDLLTEDTLAHNKYSGRLFSVNTPDGHEIKAQAGCKPVKIIGKVVNAYECCKDEFEQFRLEHSRILNQKKLTGTMCLSIHPLDYMTMSDNDCDWSSCMSWKESGCYRQGTVEMMNSRTAVVAYMKSSSDMIIGHDTWNSKKWRSLFVIDSNVISSIKGYPYQNAEFATFVVNWIKELAKENLNWEYGDTSDYEYRSPREKFDHSFSFRTGYMYNDFGTCTHYAAVGINAPDTFYINYSGVSQCMWCGETEIDIDSEENLVCDDCDRKIYCDGCGDRIYEDDAYELDGYYYCRYCYEDVSHYDEISDETHHRDNMHDLYVVPNQEWMERTDVRFSSCYYIDVSDCVVENDCSRNEYYFSGDVHYGAVANSSSHRYYIYADQLTDRGKNLFGIYDLDRYIEERA